MSEGEVTMRRRPGDEETAPEGVSGCLGPHLMQLLAVDADTWEISHGYCFLCAICCIVLSVGNIARIFSLLYVFVCRRKYRTGLELAELVRSQSLAAAITKCIAEYKT